MFLRLKFVFLAISLLSCPRLGLSANLTTLTYHGPESKFDVRYAFHWKILKKALEVTTPEYGPIELKQGLFMTEERQLELMKSNSPSLQVMIREDSEILETLLEPVRLPIDRNLIGYRLFLINKKSQKQFNKIKTLDDFKSLSIVQGAGWGDIQILKQAGFNVKTEVYYDDLFKLTAYGRYDGFPRGLNEVGSEFDKYSPLLPDLAIENNLLLFYPLPTYFWFQRSSHGRLLAQRVEKGMHKLVKTGDYEKLFNSHYLPELKKLDLAGRHLIKIPNPVTPANQSSLEPFWHFNPLNNTP